MRLEGKKSLKYQTLWLARGMDFKDGGKPLAVWSSDVVIVQLLSHVRLFVTPWTAACQASLLFTISWSLLRLNVHWVNDAIQPSRLLLSPSHASIFPSTRVFSDESALLIKWQKYWSFSFSISPSNEYSGLISFRMDWLDLLAVQGTLKSLLQHYSSKASILWHSPFFMVQL